MDRARAELAASQARVAAVLVAEPWPDSADRNPGRLQDAARDVVKSEMNTRAATAAAALARAEQLRGRIGFVPRVLALVGLQTPSVQAAAQATTVARRAARESKTSRLDYRENLLAADRSGTVEADRRQRQQAEWEGRPRVKSARQEDAGNRMVVAAVKAGDPEIQAILRQEDGLRIARETMLRRQAARLAQVSDHHNRSGLVRAAGPVPEMAAAFRR